MELWQAVDLLTEVQLLQMSSRCSFKEFREPQSDTEQAATSHVCTIQFYITLFWWIRSLANTDYFFASTLPQSAVASAWLASSRYMTAPLPPISQGHMDPGLGFYNCCVSLRRIINNCYWDCFPQTTQSCPLSNLPLLWALSRLTTDYSRVPLWAH